MVRITNIAVLGLLLAATCGTPALAEPSAAVKGAIRAYQAKDYRGGIKALAHAGEKDELAHYYRALCYQQLSDFGEAETEYQWDYNNARDRDLAAKSWQGLQGLEKVRRSRGAIAFNMDQDSDKSTTAEKPVAQAGRLVKPPVWNVEHTPGCGKHAGQF